MKVRTQIDGTGQCQSMLPNVQKNVLYDFLCQGYGFEVVKSVAQSSRAYARNNSSNARSSPDRTLTNRSTSAAWPRSAAFSRGAALRLPFRLRPAPIVKEEWPTYRVRLSGERYWFRANIRVYPVVTQVWHAVTRPNPM